MQSLENILFLDVETVPEHSSYLGLDKRWKELWDKKASYLAKNNESPQELYSRAGIYAEFGKIVCISVGYIVKNGKKLEIRIKSFAKDDEKELLMDFCSLLNESFNTNKHFLCAHNGKEFDFPFLCRRILVNKIKMPFVLKLAGKKPWEIRHIDTMHLWKFGDFKAYTSLDLLAAVFDVPSPKNDIDGSMVFDIYYTEKDLPRIVSYCQKDVVTLASIYLRMNNLPALTNDQIIEV